MPRALVSLDPIEREQGRDNNQTAALSQYAAVCRQHAGQNTCSTLVLREHLFQFAFLDRLSNNARSAQLRIVSSDGTHEKLFAMSEGVVIGNMRLFTFSAARPGLSYRGELVHREERYKLFGPSSIFRLSDPNDPYDALNAPLDHYHLENEVEESSADETSFSAETPLVRETDLDIDPEPDSDVLMPENLEPFMKF